DELKAQASVGFGGAAGVGVSGLRKDARMERTNRPQAAPAPPNPFFAAETTSVNGALSSIAQTAAARELGELFEYRISAPVTIRKSESAMLPFLQDKITARKLLIYSDQSSA